MSEVAVSQVTSQETRESSDLKEPFRRRLPDERQALTHHFSVGGQEGYLTVGLYADGVPLKVLCQKFSHTRFEPSGFSGNPQIGYAKSLMDYMFRWLALKFLPKETLPNEDASITEGNATAGAAVLHSGPPGSLD